MRAFPLLLLAACTGPRMHRLVFEPQPSSAVIEPDCRPSDASAPPSPTWDTPRCITQRERDQSWRPQPPLPSTAPLRLVFTADAGVRRADDPTKVAAGPRAVASAAMEACGGSCSGAVFLGDNLYTNGLNDSDDSAWLADFVEVWSWAGDLRFVLGNHDWGPVRFGDYEAPERDRAQRLFRELAAATGPVQLGGDAHFWRAESESLGLVGLDSNYVVRRCSRRWGAQGIRCKGDPAVRERSHISLQAAAHDLLSGEQPWTVVVGHHPWRSNGEHGDAGHYRDEGLPLWPGRAYRRLLDEEVPGASPLYLSGHDHSTQAHLDDGVLSIVVGAGGKVDPPGPQGPRRRSRMAIESYCTLGFAVVEVTPDALAVELHRITTVYDAASEEDYAECTAGLERNRPELPPPGPGCTRFIRDLDGPWVQEVCGPSPGPLD